jgi:hypothetical protein
MNKKMVYACTAHNRTVYAAPAVAGLACEKTQSACGLCAFFLRHIFTSPGNLRFPLSGLQKRHIQPERYATWRLKFVGVLNKNINIKRCNILNSFSIKCLTNIVFIRYCVKIFLQKECKDIIL